MYSFWIDSSGLIRYCSSGCSTERFSKNVLRLNEGLYFNQEMSPSGRVRMQNLFQNLFRATNIES